MKMQGRPRTPYVAIPKKEDQRIYFDFAPLHHTHTPCADAFLRGESYGHNGDPYMLVFYPVILESVYLKESNCMFNIQALFMIGVNHRFYVGYFEPVTEELGK